MSCVGDDGLVVAKGARIDEIKKLGLQFFDAFPCFSGKQQRIGNFFSNTIDFGWAKLIDFIGNYDQGLLGVFIFYVFDF